MKRLSYFALSLKGSKLSRSKNYESLVEIGCSIQAIANIDQVAHPQLTKNLMNFIILLELCEVCLLLSVTFFVKIESTSPE